MTNTTIQAPALSPVTITQETDKAPAKTEKPQRDMKNFVLRFCEADGKGAAMAPDVLDGKVFADWKNVTDEEEAAFKGYVYAYMQSNKATHQATIIREDKNGVRQYFPLAKGLPVPKGSKAAWVLRPAEVMALDNKAVNVIRKENPAKADAIKAYKKYCQTEASQRLTRLIGYATDLDNTRTEQAIAIKAFEEGGEIPAILTGKGAGKSPALFPDWIEAHMNKVVPRATAALGRGETGVSKEIEKHCVAQYLDNRKAMYAKYAGTNKK